MNLIKLQKYHKLGWILHNFAPDINLCSHNGGNIYISFYISFNEKAIDSSDIKSIVVKSPTGQHWHFDSQEVIEYMMKSKKCDLAIEYLHKATTPNELPLGEYNFEIILHNGFKITEKLNVPAPDSVDTDGNLGVYTEDYQNAENPPEKFISMPKRAIINDCVMDEEESKLIVKFLVDDPRIYNGWICLYDSYNKYLGSSNYFRNFNNGEFSKVLNNGTDFNIVGSENLAIISINDINFKEDWYSIKDISNIRIGLSDGYQYTDIPVFYDTESLSLLKKVSRD